MKFFRIGDDQKPPVSCGGGWHEGDDPARQRLGRTLRRPTLRTSSRVVTVSTEVFSSGNCSAKQGFAIAKRLRKIHQVSGKCHWKMCQYYASRMENIWRNLFQTRTGVWPLWQGEQHWKVPSRVWGFPTLQCLSSGNSRLLLGPLIRDTSATHLVIFSQQHIL